jgi:uncharacterized protein
MLSGLMADTPRASTRTWCLLAAAVAAIGLAAVAARLVETDFGRVDVRLVAVPDPSGVTLAAKLYVPRDRGATGRAPAVLALHGYQNDKETQDAFALELARRGIVVLALDEVGHGGSGGRLSIASPGDRTLGGNAGYRFLKSRPEVRPDRMGVMGHSLGAMAALQVAQLNPDHRAVNSQCGPAGSPALHNLLLTQARFEEFRVFREGAGRVEPLVTNPRRLKAFGVPGRIEWDTTYGSTADGTARRAALIGTVHAGVTHDPRAVAETVSWMVAALEPDAPGAVALAPRDQRFAWKELAMLAALVVAVLSLLPLASLCLAHPAFGGAVRASPPAAPIARGAWWRLVLVNAAIAALTYPPFTSLGGLSDRIGSRLPWFRLPVGNGAMAWFLVNALIALALVAWRLRGSRWQADGTLARLGLEIDRRGLAATAALGVVLFGWVYGLEAISERALGIEFRFMWPMMRQFSAERFGLFWLYLPVGVLFFAMNGGVFLFGLARQAERRSPGRTLLAWWAWNVCAALLGLAAVWAVQYVPFLCFGTAPGFEAIGLAGFGELWPLMLFGYIPMFSLLIFLLTWFNRRTGRVYLGALVVAALATWFTAAGSVVGG